MESRRNAILRCAIFALERAGVVRVLDGRDRDPIVLEHLNGLIRGNDIVAMELCVGIRGAAFIGSSDFDVAVDDRHGGCDQSGRSVRPIGIRIGGLAIGPLKRQEGRHISCVIIVQMGKEHGAEIQISDVTGHQLSQGSVAAIDQIGPTVDDHGTAGLHMRDIDGWPGASTEQHQRGAGLRKACAGGLSMRRACEDRPAPGHMAVRARLH